MSSNKFIVVSAEERGIKVKFEPSITKTHEIEAFMNTQLSGVNTWKCFGDLIWFYCDPNLCDEDEDEDEEDSDDE